MKLVPGTYRPVSNRITMLLLTLVVMGFGLFAQYRVDATHTASSTHPVKIVVITRS